jgi:ABC-type multidrug transport system fused ATPase/permease subunit
MVLLPFAKIDVAAILRVIRIARPPLLMLVVVALLYVISAALGTFIPYVTGLIFNDITRIFSAGKTSAAASWPGHDLLLYAGITVIAAIAASASTFSSTMLVQNFVRDIRVALVKHVHAATLASLSQKSFGEINGRMSNDTVAIASQLEYLVFPQLNNVLTLLVTLVAVVLIDYRFALIMAIPLAISALPSIVTAPRFVALARQMGRAQDRIQTLVQETCTLAAALLIRNASRQTREMDRMRQAAEIARRVTIQQSALSSASAVVGIATRTLGPLFVMTAAIIFISRGSHLNPGNVLALVMYQMRLYAPFNSLTGIQSQLASMSVSAERLCELIDLPVERDGSKANVDGALSFDRVGYSLADRHLFEALTFAVASGEHVAVVGPSGIGKSTLALMLLRIVEPDRGTISIGNSPIQEYTLAALRQHTVIVSQDALLFDTTIRENLTYFNESATDDDIARCVDICRVREIVDRLPDGLNAPVGQRGARLSGGERQRICLARALLANAQMLVLDEALTGVDVAMEALILRDIRDWFAQRSIIMITHRPGTAEGFDRIISFIAETSKDTEAVAPA